MSHHLGTMTCPTGSRPTLIDLDVDDSGSFAPLGVAVLIRVPAVRPARQLPRPARRPSTAVTARIRANSATFGRRPRRRLRKPIRIAASVLLALATLALAACLLRSGIAPAASSRWENSDANPTRVASTMAPAVWLRIETAPGVSPSVTESPVILPGYLLPDDGIEESGHAGR